MRLDLSNAKEDALSMVLTKFLLLDLVPKIFYRKICVFVRPYLNIISRYVVANVAYSKNLHF